MGAIVDLLKNTVRKQAFHPSPLLGVLLNPFYFSRRSIYGAVKELSPLFSGKTLDVGCGSKPYRELFSVSEYVGMEIENSSSRPEVLADVFYSGDAFPFGESSFDHVFTFQVLEHVQDPNLFLSEISRVLKPGGTLLLSVPFVWEEHEVPYDRTRFTSYGLKEILRKHGLECVQQRKLNPGVEAIAQLFTGMATVEASSKSKFFRYFVQFFFVAPIHFFALLLKVFFPRHELFYLDNLVIARKGSA